MPTISLHELLLLIQHSISFCGVLVILVGVLAAFAQYIKYLFCTGFSYQKIDINKIRLQLGLVLTLGLEFIVAADLIGTTTAPDYYSIGIVASIVVIRTILSYTLNREINSIRQIEEQSPTSNPN